MKKSKGIVVLLLTLILTVFFCFTAAVGIGPTGTGAAKHINTGLDLAFSAVAQFCGRSPFVVV